MSYQYTLHNYSQFKEVLIENLLVEIIGEQLLSEYDYDFDRFSCREHIKDLDYYLLYQLEGVASKSLINRCKKEEELEMDLCSVIEKYNRLFTPLVKEDTI